MKTNHRAIWGTRLIFSSSLATAICLTVSWYFSTRSLWSSLIPALTLVGAVPFIIRGYVVEPDRIGVRRLLWTTWIPLADLESAEAVAEAMKGSMRVCGNGGMFSYTGWYRSGSLGGFRAFVTEHRDTVVLRFARRTIVLSPEGPHEFVKAVEVARADG